MGLTVLSKQSGIDYEITDDLLLSIRGDGSDLLVHTEWDAEPEEDRLTPVGMTAEMIPLVSFGEEARERAANTIAEVYPGDSSDTVYAGVQDVFDEIAEKIEENEIQILDDIGKEIVDHTRDVEFDGENWTLTFDTPLARASTATVAVSGNDWVRSIPPGTAFQSSPGFRTIRDQPFADETRWTACRNVWQVMT